MPLVEAKCTNCGANLKVDNTKDAAICEFCGTPFVVEKAINNYNVSNNITNSVVNIYGGNSADFIIRAGKLEKYIGASTEVVIPNSVTIIGHGAFDSCSGLSSIVIPDTVTIIETCAFCECSNIKNVVIPKSVIEIGSMAFLKCEMLCELTLSNGLKSIGSSAFSHTGLIEVIIPDSVEKIDSGAFSCCKNLKRVVLPREKIYICANDDDYRHGAFEFCRNLVEVVNDFNYNSKCFSNPYLELRQPPVPKQEEKSSGCYIATSVYGSYDCPQVWVLRRFRDYYLAKTWYGKVFIKAYYSISPTLVKLFGKTKLFKSFWKKNLDKLILKLGLDGYENTPYNDKF